MKDIGPFIIRVIMMVVFCWVAFRCGYVMGTEDQKKKDETK